MLPQDAQNEIKSRIAPNINTDEGGKQPANIKMYIWIFLRRDTKQSKYYSINSKILRCLIVSRVGKK